MPHFSIPPATRICYHFILFLLLPLVVCAQFDDADTDPRNELKINPVSLIGFEAIDIGYENLLNEESSLGIDLYLGLGEEDEFSYYRTFAVTPYYRKYFSRKFAKGFFIEGFGMLNTAEDYDEVFFDSNGFTEVTRERSTDFALGVSAGAKFVTPRGFVAEIYLGIGRNLFSSEDSPSIIGRGGISLGYRF